jgi:hypothetical protein
VIIRDKELSSSAFSHVINAPIEAVDIADWLFNLPEGRIPALLLARPHLLGRDVRERRAEGPTRGQGQIMSP